MEIKIPKLPPIPDKLPFEDTVNNALNKLSEKANNSAPVKALEFLRSKIPTVAGLDFPTPLGKVRLPELEIPPVRFPVLDAKKKDVVKAAIGDDIATLVGLIPVAGDVASEFLEDLFMGKIHETLTPEETREFERYDKISPLTTVAAIRLFLKK